MIDTVIEYDSILRFLSLEEVGALSVIMNIQSVVTLEKMKLYCKETEDEIKKILYSLQSKNYIKIEE